jgi:hypothetical protein
VKPRSRSSSLIDQLGRQTTSIVHHATFALDYPVIFWHWRCRWPGCLRGLPGWLLSGGHGVLWSGRLHMGCDIGCHCSCHHSGLQHRIRYLSGCMCCRRTGTHAVTRCTDCRLEPVWSMSKNKRTMIHQGFGGLGCWNHIVRFVATSRAQMSTIQVPIRQSDISTSR